MKDNETQSAKLKRSAAVTEKIYYFFAKPIFLYLLCFALPAVVMYLAYALFGVHPFGEGSVLVLDLNGQYVYYYEAYRDALLGDGSLIYDWSRNLSGNMFGIFAYYLASPFMILVCLFPRTAMCGAIETIQLLKIGSAAVTFAYYLKHDYKHSAKKTSIVIFSMMYALMAYMVVQLMDPMWLDGLIYLPLICHGVRRLINDGKLLPYIIPLTLMFIAHFYIGYMIGFFTFCWFVYCYFGEDGRILPKHFLRAIFGFIGGTITAILAACCVLIPIYNALKLGKLEFSTPDWSMATQFDFLTFITKLFPLSYDTVYPEGLPMVYCGTAVLLLVPLFFMNSQISIKHKAATGIMTVIMIVFMYIRPVDIVWHGFQVPNWLPYRYSFAFSFLLLLMAFEAFENLKGISAKEIGGVFFAVIVFLIWCERENYEHFEIFRTVTYNTDEGEKTRAVIGGIWFSMLAMCIYFLLVYLNKKYNNMILSIVTCTAVSLELLANSMDTLQKIDEDVAYSNYTSYEPYMSDTIDAVKHIKELDNDIFYRMEATFHRTVNDPIGTNYAGISHSSSVMNAPALTMLKRLGYAYGGHYTKYEGSTYITDSIFDIRYIMDKHDEKGDNRFKDNRTKILPDYELVTDIEEKAAVYEFYKNPYAMGLGVVANDNVNAVKLDDNDPFMNQNKLYSALSGASDVQQYFTRIMPKDSSRRNMSTAKVNDEEGHMKYYPTDPDDGDSHIDYIVEMDKDSDLYLYLPTKYERTCNVWVLDEESYQNGDGTMDFAGQFFVGDNYSILDLGNFVKGQDVRVRITIDNDDNEAYWREALFYSFDYELFKQSAAQIQSRTAEITEMDNTRVSFKCSAEDSQYLFTTIPDEPGWVVTVNGKQVATGLSADALITVPLEKGENLVEMRFDPGYYRIGIILSIVGIAIIGVIFLFEYKNGKIIAALFYKEKAGGNKENK